MARSALDCALMLEVMAGHDASDPTSSTTEVGEFVGELTGDLGGLRVGVDWRLMDAIRRTRRSPPRSRAAVTKLGEAGAQIVDIEIPHYEALVSATMNGWTGEALANHLTDLRTRWVEYGRPTRIVMATGAFVSSADYVQAQHVRRVGAGAIAQLMRTTCDVVVTPTAARGAPKVDGLSFGDIVGAMFTAVWNATGFPALSVPMGQTSDHLPLGLRIRRPPIWRFHRAQGRRRLPTADLPSPSAASDFGGRAGLNGMRLGFVRSGDVADRGFTLTVMRHRLYLGDRTIVTTAAAAEAQSIAPRDLVRASPKEAPSRKAKSDRNSPPAVGSRFIGRHQSG